MIYLQQKKLHQQIYHMLFQEEIGQQVQLTIITDTITETELQVQQLHKQQIVGQLLYGTLLTMLLQMITMFTNV